MTSRTPILALLALPVWIAVSPSALAVDKQELKLQKCAAAYAAALSECEKLADAVACYVDADNEDLGCRQVVGAVGHSTVPPAQQHLLMRELRIPRPVKKPLNCTGGPLTPVVCADGHARKPEPCVRNVPSDKGFDRQTFPATVDGDGQKDTCEARLPVKCPAGFFQIARAGEDLCWDSSQNAALYKY